MFAYILRWWRLWRRPPLTPTSIVTLNGNTRGRVVLSNGETVTLKQGPPDRLRIIIKRRAVAEARTVGGVIVSMKIDDAHGGKGIEGLLTRSVVHSAGRM